AGFKNGVLVGDLNDRGPRTKEMIAWAIKNETLWPTLDSNHGDLMVDFYDGIKYYSAGDFLRNGGYQTLISYGMPIPSSPYLDPRECVKWARELIPKEHI